MNVTRLKTPFQIRPSTSGKITLSIGNIKSTDPIVGRIGLYGYLPNKVQEGSIFSPKFPISNVYESQHFTFDVDEVFAPTIGYVRMGLTFYGISDSTEVRFNHLMMNEGEYSKYHPPLDAIEESQVYLNNNFYVGLYTSDTQNYLQIIRPHYDNFSTKKLTKSKCTVLAPHLENEQKEDSPANLGLEYMMMNDQVINILR